MWSGQTILPIADTPPPLAALRANFAEYGLGWRLRDYQGRKIVSHTGGLAGMSSQITLVPAEKLGLVILTNSESDLMAALTYRLLDDLLGAPRPRGDWVAAFAQAGQIARAQADSALKATRAGRDSVSQPSLPLARYAGPYRDELYGDAGTTLGARPRHARVHAPAGRGRRGAPRPTAAGAQRPRRRDSRSHRARRRGLSPWRRPASLVGIHQLAAAPCGHRGRPDRHRAQEQLRRDEPDRDPGRADGNGLARTARGAAAGRERALGERWVHGEPGRPRRVSRSQAPRYAAPRRTGRRPPARHLCVDRSPLLRPPRRRAARPRHRRAAPGARGPGVPDGCGGVARDDRGRSERGARTGLRGGQRRDGEHWRR